MYNNRPFMIAFASLFYSVLSAFYYFKKTLITVGLQQFVTSWPIVYLRMLYLSKGSLSQSKRLERDMHLMFKKEQLSACHS